MTRLLRLSAALAALALLGPAWLGSAAVAKPEVRVHGHAAGHAARAVRVSAPRAAHAFHGAAREGRVGARSVSRGVHGVRHYAHGYRHYAHGDSRHFRGYGHRYGYAGGGYGYRYGGVAVSGGYSYPYYSEGYLRLSALPPPQLPMVLLP